MAAPNAGANAGPTTTTSAATTTTTDTTRLVGGGGGGIIDYDEGVGMECVVSWRSKVTLGGPGT